MNETKEWKEDLDKILYKTALYYSYGLTDDLLKMYHTLLDGYSILELRVAFIMHMRESKFFPKADEIIKQADLNRNDGQGTDARALSQWIIVTQAVVESLDGELAGWTFERLLPVQIKGKSMPVHIYRVWLRESAPTAAG